MQLTKESTSIGSGGSKNHNSRHAYLLVASIVSIVTTMLVIVAFTYYIRKYCRQVRQSDSVTPITPYASTHARQDSEMELKKKDDDPETPTEHLPIGIV